MKWKMIKTDKTVDLTKNFAISRIISVIAVNRGIRSTADANLYFNGKLSMLADAHLMKDIDKAIEVLRESIRKNEKIFIYGDYDADGVCSTVILYKGLKELGADVDFYIPDRETEGYGLNISAVDTIKERGGKLILTCDNGISAMNEVSHMYELGMRCIITDHHEPRFENADGQRKEIVPSADAIIDPKQAECKYPFKVMCGAGIAYRLIKSLFDAEGKSIFNETELFTFSAIATICDIVDLLGENRIISKVGLHLLNTRRFSDDPRKCINKGLKKLLEIRLGNDPNRLINEYVIGYIIGPCINASGRLKAASLAVELFISDDDEKTAFLAQELSELNTNRKAMTNQASDEIISDVLKNGYEKENVIVVYNKNVSEAVAGISAGRVKEKFYRPTMVLTKTKEDGIAKGSARSIKGYNMFESMQSASKRFEIEHNSSLFIKYGGHDMAAGFSINESNIDILRKYLNEDCSLTDDELEETINIDMELNFADINMRLCQELELLLPFGKENTQPIFITENVEVISVSLLGQNKNTLKLLVKKDGRTFKALSFNLADRFTQTLKEVIDEKAYDKFMQSEKPYINLKFFIDIVYYPEINVYNDIKSIQLCLKDYKIRQEELKCQY